MPRTTSMPLRPRALSASLARTALQVAVSAMATTVLAGAGGAAAQSRPVPDVRATVTDDESRMASVSSAPAVPDLRWRDCEGATDGLELQCAVARVPMSYRNPSARSTTVALVRARATDPPKRIGSLFVNPGGPGASGVDFVRDLGSSVFSARVRQRYDIVGFDPRFVGASDPATCFASAEDEAAATATFTPFPLTRGEARRHIAQRAALASSCRDTAGERMRHGSTANAARDLDLLRQAVGDERLNFVGLSYGTFLGATYARLFPDRLGRMVADGPVDPVSYSGRDGDERSIGARSGQARASVRAFDQFLEECRAAGARCALNGLGDPGEVVPRILESLKGSPRTIDLGGTPTEVDYPYAVALSFDAMSSPAVWTPLADTLAALAAPQPRPTARSAPRLSARSSYPSVGGTLASACVDSRVRIEPRQFHRLATREDRRSPGFGRFRAWNGVECSTVSFRDRDAYRGTWQQTTGRRVLVVGTRYDPATPYPNTRRYADLFPRSSVLTVEGFGHTTVGLSSCAEQVVTAYLVSGRTPRPGATCDQDVLPFAAPRP